MGMKKLRTVGNGVFKWEIQLRIDDRRIHRKFDDTPEGAAALYADLLKEKNRSDFGLSSEPAMSRIKLVDAIAEYERTLLTRNMNAKHMETVSNTLKMLVTVAGDKMLGHVTPAIIIQWQNARRAKLYNGKAPSGTTMNRDRAHLSAFFEFCVTQTQWIKENPVRSIRKVRQEESPLRGATFEEFSQLASTAWKLRPALAMLIEVIGDSGCRIGEAIRANAGDVQGMIWQKRVKGGRLVKVQAEPWVRHAAQAAPGPESPLCPREDGKRFGYRTTLDSFRLMCKKAGLREFTPHCLRHGRATWDIEAGAQGKAVQQKLAHTSIATTERYFREANALATVDATLQLKRRQPPVCQLVTNSRGNAGQSGTLRDKGTRGKRSDLPMKKS